MKKILSIVLMLLLALSLFAIENGEKSLNLKLNINKDSVNTILKAGIVESANNTLPVDDITASNLPLSAEGSEVSLEINNESLSFGNNAISGNGLIEIWYYLYVGNTENITNLELTIKKSDNFESREGASIVFPLVLTKNNSTKGEEGYVTINNNISINSDPSNLVTFILNDETFNKEFAGYIPLDIEETSITGKPAGEYTATVTLGIVTE